MMRASVETGLCLGLAVSEDLSFAAGVAVGPRGVSTASVFVGSVEVGDSPVEARLRPREEPAYAEVESKTIAATRTDLQMGLSPRCSDCQFSGGDGEVDLPHLNQARTAVATIDKAENRPHDRTPLLINGE
jgi:hypothetical protein